MIKSIQMFTILQTIRDRIASRKCVQKYHTHKEWLLFFSLVAIVSFLVVWSASVNFQLSEIKNGELRHNKHHYEFNLSIIETQLLVIEYLKTNNPELQKQAINKLTELNEKIKAEKNYD